jgi:hypothetical protein
MGQQIIKQPDGLYAVFSSVVDAFILLDCTRDDLIEHFMEQEKRNIVRTVDQKLGMLDKGEAAYYQFTMTWDEALAEHRRHVTDDPEGTAMVEEVAARCAKIKRG